MKTILTKVGPNWPLVGILLFGLALRVWGASFALPYLTDPDEGTSLTIALRILHTGDLNPRYFDWPSLTLYLYTLVYLAYFVLGRLAGAFTSPTDLRMPDIEMMAVGKTFQPEAVLFCREATAIVGTLSILAVYLICRRMSAKKGTAYLAALLLAVEFVDVEYSHIIRPDTFIVFFALWSLYFALKILDDPSPKNYLLAAVLAGLATSSKYNAALIVVPLLVAHWTRLGARGFLRKQVYLAVLASALSFFLTTPFAILDFPQFFQIGPLEVAAHYASGHPGAEGNSLQWYVSLLWTTLGLSLPLALGHWIYLGYERGKRELVFLSFPVVYLVFINLYTVHFAATILPIIPFLLISAALLVERLYIYGARRIAVGRTTAMSLLIGSVFLLTVPPLLATADYDVRIAQPDARAQARQWIDDNLPQGSRIALEAYSPYVDRSKYVVAGFYGMPSHSPDWYVSEGYEYLIFSSGMFGRYFEDPTLYASDIDHYNSFFSRFTQVACFSKNGDEVRIYRTGATLPTQRVAARFRDHEDVIELVGYNSAAEVSPGQDLNVRLFWRTLRQKSESLKLELRLLGREDRQSVLVQDDLFQGRRWPQGLFSGEWTIPIPQDTPPGLYRIEVNVVEARYAYRTSVMNWADQKMNDLALGPIKVGSRPPSAVEIESAREANIHFGDEIALLGYAPMNTIVRAGDILPLRFYWQSLKHAQDYTVFVHLLDSEGKLRAQIDSPPLGGTYPTSIWDIGEIVRTDYVLALHRGLEPGTYHIEVGLYEPLGSKRLNATDTGGNALGDHWVLPTLVTVTH